MNIIKLIIIAAITLACDEAEFESAKQTEKKIEDATNNDASNGAEGLGELVSNGIIDVDGKPVDGDGNGVLDALEDKDGDGVLDGYVDTDGDGVKDSLPKEISDVIGAGGGGSAKIDGLATVYDCDFAKARGYLLEATETLVFEGNRPGGEPLANQCNWDGEDGGKAHGYKTWKKNLTVSSDRVLCAMEFSSAESMEYDDAIMLTINDKTVFWGNMNLSTLEMDQGLYKYDWGKLRGQDISNGSGSKAGCAEGSTSCQVPDTETTGNLSVIFSDAANIKLMKELETNGPNFQFRAFGDDDESKDCTHTGLNLKITYKYFEK